MWAANVVVFLSLLAGGTSAVLMGYAWRRREEPGAAAFAALMFGSLVWALTYATGLTTYDPSLRFLLEVPLEVGKAIIAPAWLVFALRYTGHDEFVTRRFLLAIMVVPALTIGLVWTNPSHHLMWTNYHIQPTFGLATVAYRPQVWFGFHSLYGFLLVGVGFVAVLEMLLAQGPLYREQALALGLGSLFPTVTYVKRVAQIGPAPYLDLTPVGLAIMGLAFSYALFRFELFGLVPATRRLGRRAVIDDVSDAIVIVDDDARVIDTNASAEALFGDAEALLGEPLDALTDVDVADLETTPEQVRFEREEGPRTYEVTASPIEDQHDRRIAYTVTFHDVTERENRRQRLEVLNRVLRHNLRNDMTVIIGNAELLAERTEGAEQRAADVIVDRGEALADLSERAREVEEVMGSREGTPDPFDAVALVEQVCETMDREYPEATVTVSVPDRLQVRASDRVFEAVLKNLLDNALAHNENDAPRATVSLARTDGGIELRIEDNGPGIPSGELTTLEAGAETPLEHGSGMGLWLVTWGVQAMGGDVEFVERGEGGTSVRVTLPDVVADTTVDTDHPAGAGGSDAAVQ
jgi:PAS domain S-box-containing protein